MTRPSYPVAALAIVVSQACAVSSGKAEFLDPSDYGHLVEKAAVWHPTDVAKMNLRTGPGGQDAFEPLATVRCTHVEEAQSGTTPKFSCKLPNGDKVKVKYGRDNGEVYAEVAATRLLWALGFGADSMYPTLVECDGCPAPEADAGATRISPTVFRFDYAAIERKMHGVELEGPIGAGWSWEDLDRVGSDAGPDAVAHRDALKLLAVMLQHTDSKRQQQRLVCLDEEPDDDPEDCKRPFMMISDLGKTFGKANKLNNDSSGSVNLQEWAATPVWVGTTGCVGNLSVSLTGTLDNPKISEAGRKFLAGRLAQLTEAQLTDLFDGARFPLRGTGTAPAGDVIAWVSAFRNKVDQVSQRSCGQDPL